MIFSLKTVVLGALFASVAVAAPVEVDRRDANSDRISACFVGLVFTGSWPGSCQAAVAANLGLIRSIAVNQMSMDFTPANPWVPATSSNSIVATMLSIPGITLPIDSVRQHIIIVDNGVQIGNIDTPWSAASVKGGALTTSFTTSNLNVFSTAHTAFSSFISALSTSASHPVTLQGAVDVKLNLGIFGHLTIPGIGFKATTPFAGLNNLNQIKYIYMIDTLLSSSSISLTSIINIVNPSQLTLSLGTINFSTSTDKGYVGISTIKNLVLVPGDNYVLSYTDLDTSYPAVNDFLNTLPVADVSLFMAGYNSTSTNVALNAGLAVVKSKVVVPGGFNGLTMSQPPYKNWSLKVLPTTKTDHLVEITATFQSPYYGIPIKMVFDNEDGQDNYAYVSSAVSPQLGGMRLFDFQNTINFSVSGKTSATITFKVPIKGPFTSASKSRWQGLVDFAKTKGYIPVNFMWLATVTVNNDGTNHQVDWGSIDFGDTNIAVGSDFASILDSFSA
ncbi:hypothetical protein EDD21DRAFT_406234 [Dissophora ornata]|nr:hypothetical protein BGZ58_007999 [Dissophora ornata]KAI8599174.1 hypothetical protein EDD21DRAFT_406234 [Dissophora ornata]